MEGSTGRKRKSGELRDSIHVYRPGFPSEGALSGFDSMSWRVLVEVACFMEVVCVLNDWHGLSKSREEICLEAGVDLLE